MCNLPILALPPGDCSGVWVTMNNFKTREGNRECCAESKPGYLLIFLSTDVSFQCQQLDSENQDGNDGYRPQ